MDEFLRSSLGRRIEIKSSLEPRLPEVWIDRGHAELLIANLALNAKDAMPSGGTLSLATSAAPAEPSESSPGPGT